MMTLNEAASAVTGDRLLSLRSYIAGNYPVTMKALQLIDTEYKTAGRPKGYNLVRRENKKLGFVYYVRYWHEGSMLGSKWCTHTSNYEEARAFAERNRDGLISRYLCSSGGRVVQFFTRLYESGSAVYRSECRRNGGLSEGRRKRYLSVMLNKFVPFLRERRVTLFDQITVPLLDDFQDRLLAGGMKAQSVNDDLSAVGRGFKYLARKGAVKENPFLNLNPVPERPEDKKTRGCYETGKLKGVFNKRWKDRTSLLLNLLIYTTDMRNSEIKQFGRGDIVKIEGCHFIDLKRSKTGSGVRLVPLHDAVYRKIMTYAEGAGGPVFGGLSPYRFRKANRDLAGMLKISETFLKERNITYYSGRHFWKTLMNAEGLGEGAEEIFMGHKVSGDVSKLYNHRDMQGRKRMVKKAREAFRILDRMVFA